MDINNKNLKFSKPYLRGDHQVENAATAIASILQIEKLIQTLDL